MRILLTFPRYLRLLPHFASTVWSPTTWLAKTGAHFATNLWKTQKVCFAENFVLSLICLFILFNTNSFIEFITLNFFFVFAMITKANRLLTSSKLNKTFVLILCLLTPPKKCRCQQIYFHLYVYFFADKVVSNVCLMIETGRWLISDLSELYCVGETTTQGRLTSRKKNIFSTHNLTKSS